MAAWLTYLKERFPLASYGLLAGGLAASGNILASPELTGFGFFLAFFGILLFFAELRLMDELKDYDKDVLAHPDRPLPRGLLRRETVDQVVKGGAFAMLIYAGLVALLANGTAGIAFLIVSAYLWLMYREFYLGEWLQNRPLLYAFSHQIILLPLCTFAVVVVEPDFLWQPGTLNFGLAVLGSFFAYEVCRKLNPAAHPVLKTYLYMYGPRGSSLLVFGATALAAVAAWNLGLQAWLWPFEGLLLVSLVILFVKPHLYKVVEAVATLSLLFHIWAITFRHLTVIL